jgi:endonuclease/exonuclease/phosphatase family metal-dependent hydrolase
MKILRSLVKVLLTLIAVVIAAFVVFVIYLTAAEYRPEERETLPVQAGAQTAPRRLAQGDALSILTWNIGYASLDSTQDFVMDGGKGSRPATDANVQANTEGIRRYLQSADWDFILIQEADRKSRRSYYMDEVDYLASGFAGFSAYATNFRSVFVPFPVPEFMGRVESGLLTLNRVEPLEALRIGLSVPFKWPVRTANLKRCLLVERFPVTTTDGSSRELVLVNLHLEAYASREEQTRELLELIKAEYAKGNYVIAGGDFNQTFPGINETTFALKNTEYFVPGVMLQDMLDPGWQYAIDPETPTARLLNEPFSGNYETTQLYIIDGFIISPNVELAEVAALDMGFRYSDHNPVTMNVLLR